MDCLGGICDQNDSNTSGAAQANPPFCTIPKNSISIVVEDELSQCEFDTKQLTLNSFPKRSSNRYTEFLESVPAQSVRVLPKK